MPARVRFVRREAWTLHSTNQHRLPRTRRSAGDDHALTDPLPSEPREETWSVSWVHGGRLRRGVCCWGTRVSMRQHSGRDTGHVGKRRATRAGLSANRMTTALWRQARVGLGGAGGYRRQFVAWRPQGYHCTQASRPDRWKAASRQRKRIKIYPATAPSFKKKKKVAVTSNQHFPDASSGNVTGCPTREQIQKSGSPAPQGPERHCTIPPRRQPPIRVHCHTERAHCHPAPPGPATRLLDRPRGLCINPRKGPLQKWDPGRRWHPAFLCGLRYSSDWLLYRAWKCSSVYYKSQIVIFIFLGLM